MREVIYAIWISGLQGMTPYRCYALFEHYGNFEDIYRADYREIAAVLTGSDARGEFVGEAEFDLHRKRIKEFERYYEMLASKNVEVLTPVDSNFPKRLKEISDCPVTLYKKGVKSVPKTCFAIVGARRCSVYGRKVALEMARELSKAGVNVVSGLAYGVDVAAHQGALNGGGLTTAVLGGGLHRCYPAKHDKIFDEIIQTGWVVSEEPFGRETEPYMFPKRNRIISGMCEGVLVVEAAKKSGSLITVDFALEQGRDVFTVPGRLYDSLAEGTNNLIRQGAKIVFDYDDILTELKEISQVKPQKTDKIEKSLEEKEKIVYSCISYDPIHIDCLRKSIFETIDEYLGSPGEYSIYNKKEIELFRSVDDSDIHMSLLTLELKGLITNKSGCYYARSEV